MVSLHSSPTNSSMDNATRRNRLRRAILENLERRELMASNVLSGVYAPNTTIEYWQNWEREANQAASGGGNTGGGNSGQFNVIDTRRWTNPVGGVSPNVGDPATITWSIVRDGTVDTTGNNRNSSDLIAFMDSIYGGAGVEPTSAKPWFHLFRAAYDRWSRESGLTFVYEPNDDGADISGSNRGIAGVRGDVRIGGRRIDGDAGILAFNYYPNEGGNNGFDGDMIIDTSDAFFRTSSDGPNGENRILFNVLMHEAGHGIGLGHVIPIEEKKLMEPFVSDNFLGAQHDDILGAHALYGDDKEKNNTTATATPFGQLGNGTTALTGLSLTNANDVDFYNFRTTSSGKATVRVVPIGEQYLVAPDTLQPQLVNTLANQNLALEIISSDGTVLGSSNIAGIGSEEVLSDVVLPSSGDYYIRVTGSGSGQPQLYRLALNLSGIVSGPAAVTGPRLLSVAPNSGEIFSFNQTNTLRVSPTELVFRFDGASPLNASTIENGILVIPADANGNFIDDNAIIPGWVGFGDTDKIVIVRFTSALPDNLYRVKVMGVDNPALGITAVRNLTGLPLIPRIAGAEFDAVDFRLELGAQILSVVPQPVVRTNGVNDQRRDQIQIFFNNDKLWGTNVATGDLPINPTVVDPAFYALIADRGTVTTTDDVTYRPSSITYDVLNNLATLTFPRNLDELDVTRDTSFRLRIGTNEVTPAAPLSLSPSDPVSTFTSANTSLGVFNNLSSFEVNQTITNPSAFPLDFPGAPDMPGSREINPESKTLQDNPDSGVGVTVQFYNFNTTLPYGRNSLGVEVFSSITEQQKQRAREVFEFFGAMMGIKFVETEDFQNGSWTIVTGDLSVFGSEGGQGGTLGIAGSIPASPTQLFSTFGRRTVVLDASENWNDEFGSSDQPAKPSWFTVAMHEIGHLMGFGHASELPPGTIMGGLYSNATNGGESSYLALNGNQTEPIFPGANERVVGNYLYRPDSRDIDMYRFEVAAGKPGLFSAEVIAERNPESSLLDSFLTLFRERDGKREVVAINDDYFSKDSFLQLSLEPGVYYLGVSASGNATYNPEIQNTGMGGVSEGAYKLRVAFRPIVSTNDPTLPRAIVDLGGSALDGDGDGIAGGVFNFWFNAAAPVGSDVLGQRRALFVDKAPPSNAGAPLGSLENPYPTIADAFAAAQPGDVVRLLPNGGIDGLVNTVGDNWAYEVGRGGLGNSVLRDGENMELPRGVTVMADAGVLFKMGASSIGVGSSTSSTDRSKASLQLLGTPRQSVLFTSYNDETMGVDTSTLRTTPRAGDWGGVIFRNAIDRAEGRFDPELAGRFLNHVSYADMKYGGGRVNIDGRQTVVNPITMVSARPTIVHNLITLSADAALSADPDSFEETNFTTSRYQSDAAFTPDYNRVGPEVHGNTLLNNSINGLFVRVDTLPGQPAKTLTVAGRFDDTDVVHVISDVLTISSTPGGPRLETTPPSLSVVNVSQLTVPGGALLPGQYSYRMTFVDANGNEAVASAPTQAFSLTAPNNSIRLDALPGASSQFVARRLYRSFNGGAFNLVAEIDRSTPFYTDSLAARATVLNTATAIRRARLDASLVIDPGSIIKLSGGTIVAGIGANLIAEGTADLPIIFTSRKDDRYGAAGTFDTNNDGAATGPAGGDWGGLYFSQTSSGSIDHSLISFAGGIVSVGGTFAGFNPVEIHQSDVRVANSKIENNSSGVGGQAGNNRVGYGFNESAAVFVRGAEPVFVDNVIQNNSGAAISINSGALSGNTVRDLGRQRGMADRRAAITENKGPLFRGNEFGGNDSNGLVLRGQTLNSESIWDDTDIVHIVYDEIVVPDFYVFGGLRLQSSPNESLVVKLGPNAGFTSTGRPLDIDDRIGGTLQVLGTPGFPVVLTSIYDDSIGAGFDPNGESQRDATSDGSQRDGTRGDWRSIRIDRFSNDRNVDITAELEPAQSTGAGVNGRPSVAQSLGEIAPNEKAGDDRLRLGTTVIGTINNPDDIDVYSFQGTAGTQVWIDIDRTDAALDTVVELIDSNGTIIAQSDNSFDESRGVLPLFRNTSLISANQVNSMPQDPYAPRNFGNSLSNTFADFYSTNPLDAGMRLVLPGATGTKNTYFVRVRSSNIDSANPLANRADLQDTSPAKLSAGKTEGQYQLQIRLREMDEIAGSTVRYSDIRFATTGIEVLGMPGHSNITGEAAEPAAVNDAITQALNLGNFGNTDRAALSVAGELSTATDVDWYRFDINQDSIQGDGLQQHLSTIIDVDYADGLSRANTTLWLFYQPPTGGAIRLAYFGMDSNVADDLGAPLNGTDMDDLSRGSAGLLDAFLGTQELPSGTYYLAITSNQLISDYMNQFERRDAGGNPLVRVEPINSLQRIAEDRFGGSPATTSRTPLQVAFSGNANAVPMTLGNIPLFVLGAGGTELQSISTMTGAVTGTLARFTGTPMQDLVMRSDGQLYAANEVQGNQVDANTGVIYTIDEATGTITSAGATGINTYEIDPAANPPAAAQAMNSNGNRAGKGMILYGLAYPQSGAAGDLFLYAVGSRGDTDPASYLGALGTTDARNYVYKLDPATMAATSAPQGDRQDLALATGGGTQIRERGYINTRTDVIQNARYQSVSMSDASPISAPALLPGDRITLVTPNGNRVFEWNTGTLSATLVADTQTQATRFPNAPTNFFKDGMYFELTNAANVTETFEIDTGRVLINRYDRTRAAQYDGATFVITGTDGIATTFEFDTNNAITAGNAAIAIDVPNDTTATITAKILAAINARPAAPAPNRTFNAVLLPGTNRISITGDSDTLAGVELSNVDTIGEHPLVLDQSLLNAFDPSTLTVGQSYDGATFTITDRNLNTITFELDFRNDGVANGNSRIAVTNAMTRSQVTNAIVAAINAPDPRIVADLPGATWLASASRQGTSNMINLDGYENLITVNADTATRINPLKIAGNKGSSLGGTTRRVGIEEYFTNLLDSQVAPAPSTPGAMTDLVAAVGAFLNTTPTDPNPVTNIGTRLVLDGATAADFSEMTTAVFSTATGGAGVTTLTFGFNDSAATLNARLFAAISAPNVEPNAILMNDGFVWVPGTSHFDEDLTDDRLDVPGANARLSTPTYTFVTGLAMIGSDQMYAVSDRGGLFRVGNGFSGNSTNNVGDFIENIYNPITRERVRFAGLTAGPLNAENGDLADILFGIDTAGVLYAFDTEGRPAFVFDDARWFIQTSIVNPTGLAFSNLDVNLWHRTTQRDADPGHGVEVAPDGSRIDRVDGGGSLYFGFVDPTNANRQPGVWNGLRDPRAVPNSTFPANYNTYDLAGGASGSIVSNNIDLSGYSPGDKPMLYFNYYLDTERANANDPGDNNFMRDSFRVFVAGDDGEWKLLATNNSDFNNDRLDRNDEHDYRQWGDNAAFQVSELYDVNEIYGGQVSPISWRQARIDLSPFAGDKLVRIRFDFDTGANRNMGPSASGGIELHAVPGYMIPDNNKTFTIDNLNSGTRSVFEFDFGLMLNIPSGGALSSGASFTVGGTTFTFSTASNAGNNVLFALNESGATIAARLVAKLTAQGLNAVVDPSSPARISIQDAPSVPVNASASLPANFVSDVPGVAAGNVRVSVNKGMTYVQVRDAMRAAMARTWNPTSQITNNSTIKFFDRTIFLWNKDIIDQGPLGMNETLAGDEYGVRESTALGGPAIERNINNNFEGVYIDDIIIGFAERGEMVTGAVASTTFSTNPRHEPDPTVQETEQGTYQVEIRRGATYAISSEDDSLELFMRLPGTRSFDTNDRLSQEISLVAPSGSALVDGQTFTLSDGIDTVTFEFDDIAITSGPRLGVGQGRVRVPFLSTDDPDTVARAIRDAINSPAAQAVLNVTAGMSDGTVTGSNFIYSGLNTPSTSRIINLHGTVAVNNQAGSNFFGTPFATMTSVSSINSAAIATSLGFITNGFDNFASDDLGDSNRFRDQGQLVILGNVIRDVSTYGIVVDAGSRTPGVLTPLTGNLPHPGTPSNQFQFNQAQLVPGATVSNNLIYGNGTGGIRFSGDARNFNTPNGPVPFGRIINNTVVGLDGAGIGISVSNNASPTLLNNVVAELTTGVTVDGSSITTVLGGMVYQNNRSNIGGALSGPGSFPQELRPEQALFVDKDRRNYYLASGSLAIDSSVDSVADRPNMTTVRRPLGIADSPIVAPDTDVTGQLRVDDPLVNTPPGLGGNVFKDRGAIDRSDFEGPRAVIQQPIDNDPDLVDQDRNETYIFVRSGSLEYFSILLLETNGTGPDANSVTADNVILTENGRKLTVNADYEFGYSANSRTIRLTPLSGIWRSDSVYEITLQNGAGTRLISLDGTAYADGDRLLVRISSTETRVFEFDNNGATATATTAIPFTSTFTAYEMTTAIARAINSSSGTLRAIVEGTTGSLMILGAQSISSSTANVDAPPFGLSAVGAIRDIAGNNLQANRATTLTQFTIVMPDVRFDYGDAPAAGVVTQANNGARHALLPVDVPLLALGQFVDRDLDGLPGASVKNDDNDALIQLLSLGTAGVVATSTGPATLVMPAGNAVGLDGQRIVITDPVLKTVTFEFNTTGGVAPGSTAVAILTTDTPAQVASKFASAVFTAVLAGRITGVGPVATGNVVTLGGTQRHTFDISAAPLVVRQLTGDVELAMPATVSVGLDGRIFRIIDGSGNVVTFELNHVLTNTVPTPVALGNIGINLDLTVATPAQLASSIADAINLQVRNLRLSLGQAVAVGANLRILSNDEDGVTFGGLFNSLSAPVTTTITSTGSGIVDAWVDWNGDGDYDDVSELVISGMPVVAGDNTARISTLSTARIGFTSARFRLSPMGGLLPGGLAVGGEVEDYLIEIVAGQPPIAVNDSYTTDEDTALNGTSVLANDTDQDTPAANLRVVDTNPATPAIEPFVAPANGTLVLNANGTFTYTPSLDFFGTDTFVYYATDPRLQSNLAATVTITVRPINDAPLAVDDSLTILEDADTTVLGSTLWANDRRHFRGNPNEDGQTLTLVSAVLATPGTGTVSVVNGNLRFTPAPHYNDNINGPVRIITTIQDGGVAGGDENPLQSSSTLTISITPVNDSPEFVMPPTHATTEDIGAVDQVGFITGIRPGPVEATDEATGPALVTENQQVVFDVRAINPALFAVQPQIDATGRLTYQLSPDVNRILADAANNVPGFPAILVEVIGRDSSSITTPAAATSAPATFTILPREVNDAPVFDIQSSTSTTEDAGTVIVPNFMTNFAPGPATALDEQLQTLTYSYAFDTNAFDVVSIDQTTGALTYRSKADVNNQTGHNLVVSVTLTDNGRENGLPAPRSTTKSFTISITPVNDTPIFSLPSTLVVRPEDNEQVIGQPTTRIAAFANPVSAGPATAVDETTRPATRQTPVFEVVSNSNPGLFEANGQPQIHNDGTLEFNTASNQNGSAVIVVQLTDTNVDGTERQVSATQTFTISITPVNDPPEFTIPSTFPAQEDMGPRTVPGFATQLRPGPANATDETENFIVRVEPVDPRAFVDKPTIGTNGTLRFQTAKDINSDTPGIDLRIRVWLEDFGVPIPAVSAEQTFTLLVSPVNDIPTFTLAAPQVTVFEDDEQLNGVSLTRRQIVVPDSIKVGPDTATDEPLTQSATFSVLDYSSPELFAIAPQISPTGELTFRTAANKNGKSVVIVRMNDGGPSAAPNVSNSELQTFTINITPVNDPPEFNIQSGLTVTEDQGLVSRIGFASQVRRGPVGTDDENGQEIEFILTPQDPSAFDVNGRPKIEVDGTLTFRTANNANSANKNFVVFAQLKDSGDSDPPNNNLSVIKTFTITVNPQNDPPIPDSFSKETNEDTQLEILAVDILKDDKPGPTDDENGQTLQITQAEITTALGGSVTAVRTAGVITSLIYRPAPNVTGTDTFLYVVQDNGTPPASGTGTITISINPINDAPSFAKGADQTVLEDAGTVTVANWATRILAGEPSSTDENTTQTVTFDVEAVNPLLFEVQPTVSSNGTLSYKPAKDAVGSTAVVVTAKDDGSNVLPNRNRSAAQTFTITLSPVNDAPVFTAGGAVTVDEDSGAYSQPWATAIQPAAGLLLTPPTATDEASQVVDFEVSTDQQALFAVRPQISSSGVLTFTPAANAFGTALVRVNAKDRGPGGPNDQNTSAVQTLTITINPVNDVPSAVPDSFTANENTVLNVPAPGLLQNDEDVDGRVGLTAVPGTFTSRLGAQVVVNADGSISYDPRSVEALQKLVTGQTVNDDFVYQARDAQGALSTQATVTIIVSGFDDAPQAVADAFTVPVGQSALLDVLKNDTDIDSQIDQRTITITALPAFGTVEVVSGTVRYTAGIGFLGIDNFAYTVKDAGGNVSNEANVTVTVNNVPRAANDTAVTTRNTPVLINVLANDSDVDGALDPTSVEIVTGPSRGTVARQADGRVLYTPPADFTGQVSFTYFVKDLMNSPSNVATVNVTVGSAWRNPTQELDVNADGFISPIDALLIINYINAGLPTNLPGTGTPAPPYLDPSGDEAVTALDALLIVNYLNTRIGGEGEGSGLDTQADAWAAPLIVTMVTPEQIVATVGPQIVREIEAQLEAQLAAELEAELGSCAAWDADESMGVAVAEEEDPATSLAKLLGQGDDDEDTDSIDDFFGQL